jgi:ribosomal protein S12 methylthiotransferase accessory factor
MFSTNGLASSLSLTEAISHALAERIERHAVKIAEQDTGNPGRMPPGIPGSYSFVDIATCPASTRSLCERLKNDGEYTVRVMDITSDIRIPTFMADLSFSHGSRFEVDRIAQGTCTHPNAEIAINRAILEAVQCLLTGLSGAREDMTLNVQSLGRHERPRTGSLATALWVRPWIRKKPFAANAGVVNDNARDNVRMMVAAAVAASYPRVLYRDYSDETARPGAGVRVLVPGTEDTNPLHTGQRARASAIRDLLHRHEPL